MPHHRHFEEDKQQFFGSGPDKKFEYAQLLEYTQTN